MPWWLWAGLAVFGVTLVVSLGARLVPVDADLLFAEASSAAERSDVPTLQDRLEKLKKVPGREVQVKYLEGIIYLAGSKPLKAIPLLKQAAEDQQLRVKSLLSLGRAYGTSGQLVKAAEVLNSIVDDPDSGNVARLTLAGMLNTVQAFEPALMHLNALEKQKYALGKVLYERGEIQFDLGRINEAAADYAAAIEADEADPTNALKAVRLLRCRVASSDFKGIDKYAELLDNPIAQNHFRAERLLAEGKLKEAITALDMARREAPTNSQLSVTYGKVMLAHNTAENARQALPEVYAACVNFPRNREYMQVLQKLAVMAENPELATKAQQNVEQLQTLYEAMREQMKVVGANFEDFEGRMKLADMAMECGEGEFAERVFRGLFIFFPDKETAVRARHSLSDKPLPFLVDLGESVPPLNPPGAATANPNQPPAANATPAPL
jgi:tetratricopeptide (TPR) repeat protein